MRLTGKTALVTGGNRGIGFEVCRQLAAEGCRVYLGSRNLEKGMIAAAELQKESAEIIVVQLDTSKLESIQAFADNPKEPLHILVNNAAILDRSRDLFTLDDSKIDRVIHTNLLGPIFLTKRLAQGMVARRWGRIVNVSSGMGAITRGLGPDSMAYRISKLALNGFTVCLAESLRGTGVLVNSVDPGWVRTEMGGPSAHKSVQEGARGIGWAVLLPDSGPSGGFFRDGRRMDW
jgi:NAD(P)-dependent dehydrogenase (short-subunit alcohol dehydrogenase family)